MGGAASSSLLPLKLTKEECYSAIGKENYLEVWNRYKDENGMVDIRKLKELENLKFDVFLSHNWSKDELGRSNHNRVGKINNYLTQRGVKTWFDEEQLKKLESTATGLEQIYESAIEDRKSYLYLSLVFIWTRLTHSYFYYLT